MTHLEIINNSEKYIKLLQERDKIFINFDDIKPSEDLIKSSNHLWGYYNVKSFTINNNQIDPYEIFPNYYLSCGDCFNGKCFIQKRKINENNK